MCVCVCVFVSLPPLPISSSILYQSNQQPTQHNTTASEEAAKWADEDKSATVLIDASTAFRVADDWTYGFPELCDGHRDAIAGSQRISNPGCE